MNECWPPECVCPVNYDICWNTVYAEYVLYKCQNPRLAVLSGARHRRLFNLILGDPEVTAHINCKARNLPNTDTQNYSTDLRELLRHPEVQAENQKSGLRIRFLANAGSRALYFE